MKAHFEQFAGYNRWANACLYTAALALPDEAWRRPIGLFFGSVHATLNHLLFTDRMWLGRLIGGEFENGPLDRILHDDRIALAHARIDQDERLIATIGAWSDAEFGKSYSYRNSRGGEFTQPLGDILAHLFNHQTHHRGQVHSGLSILTSQEPPPLDLLMFQRGFPAPDLAAQLKGL